jgi:hypothetical protein
VPEHDVVRVDVVHREDLVVDDALDEVERSPPGQHQADEVSSGESGALADRGPQQRKAD